MRDLATIAQFGAFMEFTDEESEDSGLVGGKCDKCGKPNTLIVPKKEVKERFRRQLIEALPRGVPNLAPSMKHFWFFARCSECKQEIVAMRS